MAEFLQIPQGMVKLVIQRYTREAGVRNLERNLAVLARAAAVRIAEQEQVVPLNKVMQGPATPLLENRLADSTIGNRKRAQSLFRKAIEYNLYFKTGTTF